MGSAPPGVPVVNDVVPGLDDAGFNGVVACIGEGDGSCVLVALLGRVPGVCLATRRV